MKFLSYFGCCYDVKADKPDLRSVKAVSHMQYFVVCNDSYVQYVCLKTNFSASSPDDVLYMHLSGIVLFAVQTLRES